MNYIKEIEKDIAEMKEDIRYNFAVIAMIQKHIRIAESAIEWHKKEDWIEGILKLCRNGK
jgi:hypothetical protein